MSVQENELLIKRITQLLSESILPESSAIELETLLDLLDKSKN